MIRELLVVVALLFARGVAATTCTLDGVSKVPDQLEPSVTSFCQDVLDTKATPAVPAPLIAFLPSGGKLSSFCSCVLDHPATTTTTTTTQTLSSCSASPAKTVTVFTSPSLATATVGRTTVTVSETAHTTTITITASKSQSLCTVSGKTVTLNQSTITITPSTVTLTPSTVTLTPSTVTLTPSTITITPSTVTLTPSTVTVTVSATIGPPTCTPLATPPANSMCAFNAVYGGGNLFLLSAYGNTAASLSACTQQCLALSGCVTISFDGTYCSLYSLSVLQLELQGVVFPVDVGVAGSAEFYDVGCLSCSTSGCPPLKSRREIVRREADVERREADLKRRMLAVVDRESAIAADR